MIGVLIILFSLLPVTIIEKKEEEDNTLNENPDVILRRRYAKGEITKEEYEEIRREIK